MGARFEALFMGILTAASNLGWFCNDELMAVLGFASDLCAVSQSAISPKVLNVLVFGRHRRVKCM